MWECLCSCGKITYVAQSDLHSGTVQSCSHSSISLGEQKIINILTEASIKFETQKTFENGRYLKSNRLMKFDFYLPDYNTLIEYDGEQHFKPIEYFGGEEAFIRRKERDEYKEQWCKENGIKLIRIPYTEYDNLTINTIILGGEKI